MIKGLQAQRRSEGGFTLIEVMVVIIMIGILAAISVPIYSNYVYRARASEGVTTMGAIKTYLIERANATGNWPTQAELDDEFKDFKELYYFDPPTLDPDVAGESSVDIPEMTVTIAINKNFGISQTDMPELTLTINLTDPTKSGWGGEVQSKWASHLPEPTA